MNLDENKYELYLAAARAERGLDLSIVKFDPKKHPRDYMGKFREVLGGLKPGQTLDVATDEGELPIRVRTGKGADGRQTWSISDSSPYPKEYKTMGRAARAAMLRSERAGGRGNLPETLDGDGKKKQPQPTKGKGVEMISSMDTEGNITEYEPTVTGDTGYTEGGTKLPDPNTDPDGYDKEVKSQIDDWIGAWWDGAYEIAGETEDEDFDFADLSVDFAEEFSQDLPTLIPGAKIDDRTLEITLPNGTVLEVDSDLGAVHKKTGK